MTHPSDPEIEVAYFEILLFKILPKVCRPVYCLKKWMDLFDTWHAVKYHF